MLLLNMDGVFPSKEVSQIIHYARLNKEWAITRMNGLNTDGTPNKYRKRYLKWKYLLDIDVKISDRCCDELKMKPILKYEKESGKKPMTAVMAIESSLRSRSVIERGFNLYSSKRKISRPMAFWQHQDSLMYLKANHIPYSSVYGDIVHLDSFGSHYDSAFIDTELKTTGLSRTGCMFCPVGCHQDHDKFKLLRLHYPDKFDMLFNSLKFADFLHAVNVDYSEVYNGN